MRTTIASAALVLLAMLAQVSVAQSTSSSTSDQLRTTARQIGAAIDRTATGSPPSQADIRSLQGTLSAIGEEVSAHPDASIEAKYNAVTRLLWRLEAATTDPSGPASLSKTVTRAQLDIETPTAERGSDCKNALGISEQVRVRATLSSASNGGTRGFWLRFDPPRAGTYLFHTESRGPDPALEIVHGKCGLGAVATDDDSFGLDAAATATSPDGKPFFVHVSNSGDGGDVNVVVDDANGTITGQVTDATTHMPLPNASILVFDNNGNFLYQGPNIYTDQNGNYSLSIGTGSYYIGVADTQYVTTIYPSAQCAYNFYSYQGVSGCETALAQTVSVASGTTTVAINIALGRGAEISGTIRDTSNQPTSGYVYLFNSSGNQITGMNSDPYGRYAFATLPNGVYYVQVQANDHGSQMYSGVDCTGALKTNCNIALATPVTVNGPNVSGINFDLAQMATIQGTVSGAPQPNYYANVYVVDSNGNQVAQGSPDPNTGTYTAGPLGIGTYFAYAIAQGYFAQIYAGVDCTTANCTGNVAAGTPVTITQLGQVGRADFQLHPLPTVTGHVQDASSGLPIANVSILAGLSPPATWQTANSTTTDIHGNYVLSSTSAGNYYLWAVSSDHLDVVYPNLPCEQGSQYYYLAVHCSVLGAIQMTIAPSQAPSAFDFSLQPASSIAGRALVNAGPASDTPASLVVSIYDDSGLVVGSANTDSFGNYVVGDLQPGTYFALATNNYSSYFLQQLWQQIPCGNACFPTTATPISVGAGAVTGIDFDMTELDAVVGRVTDTSGAPIANVVIDLFDAGTYAHTGAGLTDAMGFYAAQSPTGESYVVGTQAGPGYYDQVYSGIACPLGPAYFGLCALNNATAIPLSANATQPRIVNFVLQSNDPIFANGFE